MPSLQAAHRGYDYQDLLCATRLVDSLLGAISDVWVDKKLVPADRFDDLTVVTADRRRQRTQFKHSDNDDRPLTVETFTNDKRELRLDRLVAAAVADRDGPGAGAAVSEFRVVLRDSEPNDQALLDVLVVADPDPGPFVAGMSTKRMRFDVDRLWPKSPPLTKAGKPVRSRFSFLGSTGTKGVDRADLAWLCERLIIELEAPRSSGSMTEPGVAEQILLARVSSEIGAGVYPNAGRSAEDVADAFVTLARQAREGRVVPSADLMLQRGQLRQDFGAVSRVDPVDHAVEVARPTTVADVQRAAGQAAVQGVPLLLTGPPGQGKSWTCAQLAAKLAADGWLVAEHYCYLNDTRDEREERVNGDVVFGSLLNQLADADPTLVSDLRPRYAADDLALVEAVTRATTKQPGQRVALIVDGLDHVARVLPSAPGTDPSAALAAALAAVELPTGSVLIVLSQPGDHLAPLEGIGAQAMPIPGLDDKELRTLALRLGLLASANVSSPVVDEEMAVSFLSALTDRSQRNALYATYLCREVLRQPTSEADPASVLGDLPQFDGTLENYYSHLMARLGPSTDVAEFVGLLEFPVTRAELCELRPEMDHRLDEALATLAPVLVSRAMQGGLRVYHESFARYLRRRMDGSPVALAANLSVIVKWLADRGFYQDERAFRYLLPMLAMAGRDTEVLEMVGIDFAAKAVAAGHPASAISANLTVSCTSAAKLNDLPALIRCVELTRAAESFEYERLDSSLTDYVDVPLALLGPQVFASRLLFDGMPSLPARAGLQVCAAVDEAGAVPPWPEYVTAFSKWVATDNTSYGPASDRAIELAWVRGQLRQVPAETDNQTQAGRIADFLNDGDLPVDDTVPIAVDVLGLQLTAEIIELLNAPTHAALTLAELITPSDSAERKKRAKLIEAAVSDYQPGSVHRLLALGCSAKKLDSSTVTALRANVIAGTRAVTSSQSQPLQDQVLTWLDLCAIAARRNAAILTTVESLLEGEGWYRCWLRFALALMRAEIADHQNRSSLALAALGQLTGDLARFNGAPHAFNLYPIRAQIEDTIRRAVALLDDEHWSAALAILKQVSDGLGGSMQGEDVGPIPPRFLLSLAVDATTNSERRHATSELLDEVLAEGGSERYYSTSAEYRLVAARFALTSGDTERAQELWDDACRLMTAYGFRKDTTIYEVLDPVSTLALADPIRGRARLARLQPMCKRVLVHTDGRGTRAAWGQWWRALAQADPAALARLVVPALLQDCGHVHDLYNDALQDLWRAWHRKADPVIAGLLRLALPTPLEESDPVLVERLSAPTASSDADLADLLITLILARADERPHPSSTADSGLSSETTTVVIQELNSAATLANAPRIGIEATSAEPSDTASTSDDLDTADAPPTATPVDNFPSGLVGIARATRTWRSRSYESTDAEWSAQRYAEIIGTRLVEVAQADKQPDAVRALHTLAAAVGTFDRSGLLAILGQELENRQQPRLAAVALTLAWTHTRGQGGYMSFGGQTGIEMLHRATELNPDEALGTVTSEVTRVVAGTFPGSSGVTQAVIFALAEGALTTGEPPTDAAFATWDEACSVIETRTPRMSASDDPNDLYTAASDDDPTPEVDSILAEALIGMLAHPGQEDRRRTLIALTILLRHQPAVAAAALASSLNSLTDPAVLSWLLATIADAGDPAVPLVADACGQTLQALAQGPHLRGCCSIEQGR
ncbi:ATP-binding protein [Catenulispora rubra]|uniref:ATP-binding protein n=1 Tax=Catenulispora rubra TaxID=280293 RepID=UPI0018922E9E|nr:ATP-binding protein [Catenulispora rubra]